MIPKSTRLFILLLLFGTTFLLSTACTTPSFLPSPSPTPTPIWSTQEINTLRSLWLGNLPPLPPDSTNKYADDARAAALGRDIFFDRRFSVNGEVACVTCHKPEYLFTDSLPLAQGLGQMSRSSMTLVGVAYSPWFFWDGRKDSLWAQALEPLESPLEHGGTRTQYVHLIAEDESYRAAYEAIFGRLPVELADSTRFPDSASPVAKEPAMRAAWHAMRAEDQQAITRAFVNIGKALAAYERLIMPTASRFDLYVEAVLEKRHDAIQTTLTPDEVAGLRLFIGRAQCINCHNGPLFTNHDFHSTGIPLSDAFPLLDDGRQLGVERLLADEFNCLGPYSDAQPEECVELHFMKRSGKQILGGFKPPTLRNVAERGPYMHAGQFTTLADVLTHYNEALPAPFDRHQELRPLSLSQNELHQLETFLHTLSSPIVVKLREVNASQEQPSPPNPLSQ